MIRVLLVEDDAAHARLVHEMLKERNIHRFEYRRVDRLAAALRLLYDQHFDVVLLDLGLPDAFGSEAVVRVRKAAPSVPIVVLSGLREESAPSRTRSSAGASRSAERRAAGPRRSR